MYISRFSMKDIMCFHDISIDFMQPEKNEPCKWVVLLGENGTGKSTILQMIALALIGRDLVYDVATGVDWVEYVRTSAVKGRLEIELLTSSTDRGRKRQMRGFQNGYRAAFELGRTIRTGLKQDIDFSREDFESLAETLYSEKLVGGWFAAGYGTWRGGLKNKPSRSSVVTANSRRKSYRFISMYDNGHLLPQVSDWLVDLDFRRLKEPDNEEHQRIFNLAIHSLEQVLIGVEFTRITPDGDLIFTENGNEVSINHLSDGYRSTLGWIGDLIRRLVEAFPTAKDPLKQKGVVLIDEIDIHLHPKWQRVIVEQIRELFPNIQFVVTTHSPFVAQDMMSDDKFFVLQKKNARVELREGSGIVKGWRVDQILTSYLFDLETTRDIEVYVHEQEYQKLLSLQTSGKLSSEERRRLHELREWLRENKSSPGENAEENEIFDAANSFLDILNKYVKE